MTWLDIKCLADEKLNAHRSIRTTLDSENGLAALLKATPEQLTELQPHIVAGSPARVKLWVSGVLVGVLRAMSRKQLVRKAFFLGIRAPSKLDKEQLILAISEVEDATQGGATTSDPEASRGEGQAPGTACPRTESGRVPDVDGCTTGRLREVSRDSRVTA